jgi:hypothetical protein
LRIRYYEPVGSSRSGLNSQRRGPTGPVRE